MDSKQPQLINGAYYGPPIPPPQNSYNGVGGRRSSCGPCSCLCSLFKFLISIIIVLGIIVLVLWLVFRPNEIKVYVTSASLSQFNLTNNNSLNYDLSLNMAIRNPNRRIGIYYDYIEARALYDDSRFGYTQLPTFYQGHKNTSSLFPVLKGQGFLFGDSVTGTYDREKGEGYYYVDVKLYMRIRLRVASIVKIHAKPHIDCSLKLPVPGSSSTAFEETRCDVDFF